MITSIVCMAIVSGIAIIASVAQSEIRCVRNEKFLLSCLAMKNTPERSDKLLATAIEKRNPSPPGVEKEISELKRRVGIGIPS